MNPKVDFYFKKNEHRKDELLRMRAIALDSGLTEELKWGCPCYTRNGSNVVLIHTFKAYSAFLFFKGALLKDPKHLLVQATERVQAARQIRFSDLQEVLRAEPAVKTYIREAIKLDEQGAKVPLKKTSDFPTAEEFAKQLKANPLLKAAFEGLTPGRQRAYLLHFAGAKLSKTREARVEKAIPQILKGKGLDD